MVEKVRTQRIEERMSEFLRHNFEIDNAEQQVDQEQTRLLYDLGANPCTVGRNPGILLASSEQLGAQHPKCKQGGTENLIRNCSRLVNCLGRPDAVLDQLALVSQLSFCFLEL